MSKFKILVLFVLVMFLQISVQAEYLFLKDGSIIEGSIVKDDKKTVKIKTAEGERDYQVKNISRILYSDEFKIKKYLYLKDNSVVEGYVTQEDDNGYFIRKDLSKKNEEMVIKDSVLFISKKSLSITLDPVPEETFPRTDAVFLNTGILTNIKIISEDKQGVVVSDENGQKKINKSDVKRILYNSDYRNVSYFYREDFSCIKGHLVGETSEEYILREDLKSPYEWVVPKAAILFISTRKMKIEEKKEKETVIVTQIVYKDNPNQQAANNEGKQPKENYGWDDFYFGGGLSYSKLFGYWDIISSSHPMVHGFVSNSPARYLFWGAEIFGGDFPGNINTDLSGMQMFTLDASVGGTLPIIKGRFSVTGYVGGGLGFYSVTYLGSVKGETYNLKYVTAEIIAGLRFPVRPFSINDAIVPFVQYRFFPADEHFGIMSLGVMYAF